MKYLIAVLAGAMLVASAPASIMIYDGSINNAVTSNVGAATATYNPPTAYVMYGYNPAAINYSEAVTGVLGGSDKELMAVKKDGGIDGVLRYNFATASVKSSATGTASAEKFLNDITFNPTLSFDIIYTGGASWASVRVDINSTVVGAPSVVLLDQALPLNVAQHISVDLSAGSAFQTWVSQVGSASSVASTSAQLRINLQTATADTAGTFYIDNVQIVPEPATAGLLGLGVLAAGLLRRWTREV